MSGEESLKVESRLADIISRIESHQKNLRISTDINIGEVLSLVDSDLEKMTINEIYMIEYKVKCFSHNLRLDLNKSTAIKHWLERAINLVIANTYNEYDKFLNIEVRKSMVSLNNTYVKILSEKLMEHQLELDTMYSVSESIRNLADSLSRIGKAKNEYYRTA